MSNIGKSKKEITERLLYLKSEIRKHMSIVDSYKDEAYELTTHLLDEEFAPLKEYLLKNCVDPEIALTTLKKYVSEQRTSELNKSA